MGKPALRLRVGLEGIDLSVELKAEQAPPADTIQKALERLEALAKKKKKMVALFIDEFQRLSEIVKDHAIEAAIRHVAQTGLNQRFFKSNRPWWSSPLTPSP